MLATCCHVYCRTCLGQAQSGTNRNRCSVCQQTCSHRSQVAAPVLNDAVQAFKLTARALGLLPSVPDASLAMTQLPASSASQSQQQHNQVQSMTDVYDQLRAARTFCQFATKSGGAATRASSKGSTNIWQTEHDALVANHEQALLQATLGQAANRKVPVATEGPPQGDDRKPAEAVETHDRKPAAVEPPPAEEEEDVFYSAVQESPTLLSLPIEGAAASLTAPVRDPQEIPPTLPDETSYALTNQPTTTHHTPPEASATHPPSPSPACSTTTERSDESTPMAETFPTSSLTPAVRLGSRADETSNHIEVSTMPTESTTMPERRLPTTTETGTRADEVQRETAGGTESSTPLSATSIEATPTEARTSTPTSTASRSVGVARPAFGVGDLVQVQARTWPGVNLHGGVGRITASHDGPRYDVRYVLGGRERLVDAIFCQTSDLPNLGRQSPTRRDTTSSRRLARQQQESIPPVLLAQLKSEGFDVEGKQIPVAAVTPAPAVTAASVSSRRKRKAAPRRGSDLSENAAPVNTTSLRRGKSDRASTGVSVLEEQSAQANTASGHKRRLDKATKPAAAPKRQKLAQAAVSRVARLTQRSKPKVAPVPIPLSDKGAWEAANQKYRQRMERALAKNTVILAASSLTDEQSERIGLLCRQQKSIRIKQSNLSKQTTLCIMSADPRSTTTARFRTMKAMRAALLGIPLVTPEWVDRCITSGRVEVPTTFLRTLPSKSTVPLSEYGLAHLVARSGALLQGYQVYLCLPKRLQQDVMHLLKDAGATIVTRLAPGKGPPLVLLCGDTDNSLTPPVLKAVQKNPKGYQVVHTSWLFDSISRGAPLLDSAAYAPPGDKGKSLWELCR